MKLGKVTHSSRGDKSKILARESTINWLTGSAKACLKWEVHEKSKEFKVQQKKFTRQD